MDMPADPDLDFVRELERSVMVARQDTYIVSHECRTIEGRTSVAQRLKRAGCTDETVRRLGWSTSSDSPIGSTLPVGGRGARDSETRGIEPHADDAETVGHDLSVGSSSTGGKRGRS